jgi:glycosyltransferase involved in cell wall biosynthesis
LFPSLYEGFGLPLLEAAEAGIPIACSNLAVFREVVGDAGVYFDPYDVPGMVAAIIQALGLPRPVPAVVEHEPPTWSVAGSRLAQGLSMLASPDDRLRRSPH